MIEKCQEPVGVHYNSFLLQKLKKDEQCFLLLYYQKISFELFGDKKHMRSIAFPSPSRQGGGRCCPLPAWEVPQSDGGGLKKNQPLPPGLP